MIKNTLGSSYTSPDEISEVLRNSSRLRYILSQHYHVQADDIVSILIDGTNHKIDVQTKNTLLRFKFKGTQNVVLPDPKSGHLKMTLDPALAQGIYEIIEDFDRQS